MGGRSYEEVLRTDPRYCRWVLQRSLEAGACQDLQDFAAWLEGQELPQEEKHEEVAFGQYKGQSYEEVLRTDPSYCRWVLQHGLKDEAPPGLRGFAAWLEGQELPQEEK